MRLIDADVLKEKAFGKRNGLVHTKDIDDIPTVDATEVIMCKNCKHHDDECLWCKKLQRETENDCYCSLAKRREDEID